MGKNTLTTSVSVVGKRQLNIHIPFLLLFERRRGETKEKNRQRSQKESHKLLGNPSSGKKRGQRRESSGGKETAGQTHLWESGWKIDDILGVGEGAVASLILNVGTVSH